MIDRARHIPLRPIAWDAAEAAAAVEEVAADAIAHFDPQRFWPAHPQDGVGDGNASLYLGATGVIWALDHLARSGATKARYDFRPILPGLLAAVRDQFPAYKYGSHGSLHFGDMGTALVAMRLQPAPAHADVVYERAEAHAGEPIRELMWGLPGAMLACVVMAEIDGGARWQSLYAAQAARLLGDLAETGKGPLWTQDLYGMRKQWLGPVHGYAGNMVPLLRGWSWLTEAQRAQVADAVLRTLAGTAWRSEHGATWADVAERDPPPHLCQHCHGAAGMVTTFADTPFTAPQLEALLIEGGNFAWAAGPLAKGSNLCHGTGGNGYAFLKLYRRTRDAVWLERARAFAMTAIAQARESRAQVGRGRYTLWTGDVGLACYLWDCLKPEPRFPTVDVL
jgi:Lanthionine synthetase C-like protein